MTRNPDNFDQQLTQRQFIPGVPIGFDNSYAETDGMVVNTPNRYQVFGGAGYAVEGLPASEAKADTATPVAVMVVVAALVALIIFKRG